MVKDRETLIKDFFKTEFFMSEALANKIDDYKPPSFNSLPCDYLQTTMDPPIHCNFDHPDIVFTGCGWISRYLCPVSNIYI